jgi:hypothetical protein
MSDNNGVPQPTHNADRINIHDPYEIRRWCQRFVCTEAALRAAVATVGNRAHHVAGLVTLGGAHAGPPPGTTKPR